MKKVDLKKQFKGFYSASAKEAVMVEAPRWNYLMIDGQGDPNTFPEFQDAIGALYGVAFTLKFMLKKAKPPRDYAVMPPEGLWWCEGMKEFSMDHKDRLRWTLMILQPEFVTRELFAQALEQVKKKKDSHALSKMRFEALEEGTCAQILHIGPYATEAPTISKMHRFIEEAGYRPAGKHHEIYLGDPRRTAPEKLKTILRQPVRKKGAGSGNA